MFIQLRYLSNAMRFGVPSLRRATFRMPRSVRIGGRSLQLSYPSEQGISADFVTCCMVDEYGLSRISGPVHTILDLGSNVGFFSLAARARFPAAAIHAYEPNPRVLRHLRPNAEACGVKVFAEAVGDRAGCVTMTERGDSNQARTRAVESGDIPLVALSTAVARLGGRVDLAKIDCEGAEWEMFQDVQAWTGIRQLRMEYHLWQRHEYRELSSKLTELGFRIERHSPSGEWGTIWAARRSQT